MVVPLQLSVDLVENISCESKNDDVKNYLEADSVATYPPSLGRLLLVCRGIANIGP